MSDSNVNFRHENAFAVSQFLSLTTRRRLLLLQRLRIGPLLLLLLRVFHVAPLGVVVLFEPLPGVVPTLADDLVPLELGVGERDDLAPADAAGELLQRGGRRHLGRRNLRW